MASPVRPEFGPTLPELLGRRFGVSVRLAGVLLAGVLAIIVVAGVVKHEQPDGSRRLIVTAPVAFNLRYDPAKLRRAAPQPGELLRLASPLGARDPVLMTVQPITLEPYAGEDPTVALPIAATRLVTQMDRDPHFIQYSEGRTRLNSQPAYQIQFSTRLAGRFAFGRRVIVFPDPRDQPGAREGADLTLLGAKSKVIAKRDDVGSNGPTKIPYRSFRLGATPP